jgi:hypothetical protein
MEVYLNSSINKVGTLEQRHAPFALIEKKLVSSLNAIIEGLESEVKPGDDINFEDLTYLMELVDNCGRNEIPIGLEEWRKINAFIKDNILGDPVALGKGKERLVQYNALNEKDIKYNKKPDIAIFRSHFISHGLKTPLIFKLTDEDKEILSSPEDIEYQEFKANMVAVAKRIGITAVDNYKPNGEYKTGTRAWYFRNSLRSSI